MVKEHLITINIWINYITVQVKLTYSTQYLTNAKSAYGYSNKALVQSFCLVSVLNQHTSFKIPASDTEDTLYFHSTWSKDSRLYTA